MARIAAISAELGDDTPASSPTRAANLARDLGVDGDRLLKAVDAASRRVRLLAVRVPPEVANARRRTLKAAARKHRRTPSAESLAWADWTLLVTNTAATLLSLPEALVLVRARWQLELLFKLW